MQPTAVVAGWIRINGDHIEGTPQYEHDLELRSFLTPQSCPIEVFVVNEIDATASDDCDYERSNVTLENYFDSLILTVEVLGPERDRVVSRFLDSYAQELHISVVDVSESHSGTPDANDEETVTSSYFGRLVQNLERRLQERARRLEALGRRTSVWERPQQSDDMPMDSLLPERQVIVVKGEAAFESLLRWTAITHKFALFSIIILAILSIHRLCRRRKSQELPPKYQEFV